MEKSVLTTYLGSLQFLMKVWFFELSEDYARKFYFIKKYDLVDISKMEANLKNLMMQGVPKKM